MLKFDQDLEDYHMVDPHLVQPQSALSQQDYTFDQLSNSSSEIPDDSNCQISMEKCISLELFLTEMPTNVTTNFSDELNTPCFDINEELNVNNNIYYSGNNPFIFDNGYSKSEDSREDNSNLINCGENSVVLSDLHNGVLSSEEISGMDEINLDEYDLLTDCEDPDLWKNLSNANHPVPPVKVEPSENSNSSVEDSHHNYALRLDLNNPSIFEPVLQTPDVINTIYSFENDYKFKIQAEEVQPSAIVANLESTSNGDHSAFSWPLPSTSNSQPPSPVANRVSRKRKSTYVDEDDGDEDYVPPQQLSNYESDEESEDSPKPAKKRGRPSKRASVSSDASEPSKYREMRDKNNEASRKSRHKRRVQELHHEEELNDLTERNIKLKAECSELEATVSRFRSNIMQLLMKK